MSISTAAVPVLFIALSCFSHSIAGDENRVANKMSELASRVCMNTTSPDFCLETFRSDRSYQPEDPPEPASLASIIFRKAYLSAIDVAKVIRSSKTKIGGGKPDLVLLKNCERNYANAIEDVRTVLEDLDSDTHCFIDTRSAAAKGNATACGEAVRRRHLSPVATENEKFVRLAGIGCAFAAFIPYSC